MKKHQRHILDSAQKRSPSVQRLAAVWSLQETGQPSGGFWGGKIVSKIQCEKCFEGIMVGGWKIEPLAAFLLRLELRKKKNKA